jgi:hypothetical protein
MNRSVFWNCAAVMSALVCLLSAQSPALGEIIKYQWAGEISRPFGPDDLNLNGASFEMLITVDTAAPPSNYAYYRRNYTKGYYTPLSAKFTLRSRPSGPNETIDLTSAGLVRVNNNVPPDGNFSDNIEFYPDAPISLSDGTSLDMYFNGRFSQSFLDSRPKWRYGESPSNYIFVPYLPEFNPWDVESAEANFTSPGFFGYVVPDAVFAIIPEPSTSVLYLSLLSLSLIRRRPNTLRRHSNRE